MGTVTEMSKAAAAVEDEPILPVQAGPADEERAAAATTAIAEALDPVLVARLAAQVRAQGVQLLGRGGVQQLTKRFLEAALEAEMDEHLGYDKHHPAGRNGGNSRNGRRAKTLLTEVGPVDISVPRDREGEFRPDDRAEACAAPGRGRGPGHLAVGQGSTHGEICAHPAEVYGAEVSKDWITAVTDRVMDGLLEWQSRPLDAGRFLAIVANH